MKGRALLHHSVQLDDRATLCSVPGVKNGTILRVDKQVSQVKSKPTGKKTVMSGPASSAVDDDVMESIEMSGDDEETSSGNERRLSTSKRKRASKTSADDLEVFNDDDDDNIGNTPQVQALVPGETMIDSLSLADTNLSSRGMALRMAKKEKRQNTAHGQAGVLASNAQNLDHRLDTLENTFAPPLEKAVESPTAGAHVPFKTEEVVSPHQDVIEDDDASFLDEIYAAAAGTENPPPQPEAGPGEYVSARRCDACRRTCGCGGDALAVSDNVAPLEERIRGQEAASTNSNSYAYRTVRRSFTSKRPEFSWTGM